MKSTGGLNFFEPLCGPPQPGGPGSFEPFQPWIIYPWKRARHHSTEHFTPRTHSWNPHFAESTDFRRHHVLQLKFLGRRWRHGSSPRSQNYRRSTISHTSKGRGEEAVRAHVAGKVRAPQVGEETKEGTSKRKNKTATTARTKHSRRAAFGSSQKLPRRRRYTERRIYAHCARLGNTHAKRLRRVFISPLCIMPRREISLFSFNYAVCGGDAQAPARHAQPLAPGILLR